MIKGLVAATDIIAPLYKIAIVGDTGIGKSWLACTMASTENQLLDLDFDRRAASLQGKPNVTVKTYQDTDFAKPTCIAELESDINEWEYDFSMNRLKFKTFVIDSASYMRKALEREIIDKQSTLSRPIKIGTRVLRLGQGYDIFNANQMFTEHIISRLSQIGNLIVTFHERNEKDEVKSTAEKKAYTGMVTIDPQHLSGLLSTFNDVWRLTSNYMGQRVLITGLTDDFAGKTTLKGLAKEEVEPNIQALFAKSAAFVANGGKPQIQTSTQTPTQIQTQAKK